MFKFNHRIIVLCFVYSLAVVNDNYKIVLPKRNVISLHVLATLFRQYKHSYDKAYLLVYMIEAITFVLFSN